MCVCVCVRACACVCVCLHMRARASHVLLQNGLPLPQSLSDGEAGDHAVDLGPPLAHVVLDVEDERLLAEVGVDDLAGRLEPHRGVQVGLRGGKRRQPFCRLQADSHFVYIECMNRFNSNGYSQGDL